MPDRSKPAPDESQWSALEAFHKAARTAPHQTYDLCCGLLRLHTLILLRSIRVADIACTYALVVLVHLEGDHTLLHYPELGLHVRLPEVEQILIANILACRLQLLRRLL